MLLRLTVSKIEKETADTITIHFPQPKVHKIWYKAGQFITLSVEIEGEKHFRSYSICTAPRLDESLAITVKRLPGGLVSNYLNDHVEAGDAFDAMRPSGRFFIENSVKFERRIILIGGGSGITPLMSIIRSVLFNEPKSEVVLFFANSNRDKIIFHDKLRQLEALFPERFRLFHFISSAQVQRRNYFPGRLEASVFLTLLKQIHEQGDKPGGNLYYLCGPEALMQEAKRCLILAKVPEKVVFQEVFFADEAVEIPEALSLEAREVEVRLGGESHVFRVPGGTPILEAALQQDIYLPHSCRRGICSTCMGKKLSGEVRMAKNEALTDWEVEKGFILVCQSYPQDDDVKIEIN